MRHGILKGADLPLEVVILLIAGMTMLISGVLLFPAATGTLPYYEDGLYGLLLVMFALQIITLGKTPFGDMGRSKPLLVVGVATAALGVVACFIPGILGRIPRILLFVCFCPGGLLLFLKMCFDKDKLSTWVKYGGVFRHLILGCGMVYLLSIFMGLLALKPGFRATSLTADACILYGSAIVYLALVLRKIYSLYPEAGASRAGGAGLSIDFAMILIMGVFMVLLGTLLIPVNLGLLPFSGSAQLGLLLVIFAIQMLASGSTPIGPFPCSWPVAFFGFLFAALGIVSCIIPQILLRPLTVLVGVLNILGGLITLIKIIVPRIVRSEMGRVPAPAIITRLFAAQLTMNLLTLLFGASMLVASLIPGMVIGIVLSANGCVLLYLLRILVRLDRMQKAEMSPGLVGEPAL